MSTVPEPNAPDELQEAYDALRTAQRAHPCPDARTRKGWLKALLNGLIERREEFARAISRDFGHRSWHESMAMEVWPVCDTLRYNIKHLAKWMKPTRRNVGWTFVPARAQTHPQPKGVVGILAPWNYPLQLSLSPLASALAAGNRVVIKPSEHTPRVAEFLDSLVRECLPDDVVRVVGGGVDVAQRFSTLPWDHLLFTGAPSIGKKVMAAAAENLTPVTLELGGKSPLLVAPGQDLDRVASRIALGKLLNSGQTCIAVDTVLVQAGERRALMDAVARHVAKMYPTMRDNPDYTSVVNDRARARLAHALEDARERGATLTEINPAGEDFADCPKMPLTVVTDCPADAIVATDELFGPILHVVDYDHFDQALDWINDRPRPLALYLFDDDVNRVHRVSRSTHSGAFVHNEVFMHAGVIELPFGGIGNSGMGAYYGKAGFETFSHAKPELYQSRASGFDLFFPPFDRLADFLIPRLVGTPE